MARMKEMRVNVVDALGQESFDAPIQKGTIDIVELRDQLKRHVEMVEPISRLVVKVDRKNSGATFRWIVHPKRHLLSRRQRLWPHNGLVKTVLRYCRRVSGYGLI